MLQIHSNLKLKARENLKFYAAKPYNFALKYKNL